MRMLSTFISGLQDVIVKIIKTTTKNVKILKVLDGCIIYEVENDKKINSFQCFNNTFEVLKMKEYRGLLPLENLISDLTATKKCYTGQKKNFLKNKTFRLVTSIENKLVAIDKIKKLQMEKIIMQQTALKVDRSLADVEFWFLYRSEGLCFFLRRITKHKAYDKLLNKGELHPELSYIMNFMAGISEEDVYIDPFCGEGSLPICRYKLGKFYKLYAFDIDIKKINSVKEKLSSSVLGKLENLIIKTVDIAKIDDIVPTHSVTKIVTDPPWGFYEQISDMVSFYEVMLNKLYHISASNVKIVLLTARKEEFEVAILNSSFNITEKYHILVSGKKACIYILSL